MRQLVVLSAWVASSSALIFCNKSLYAAGFAFPLTTCAIGQTTSAACGLLMSARTRTPSGDTGGLCRSTRGWMAVAVAATVGTLWLGNSAYLYLTVAFIQIVKGFTPCLTLALAVWIRQERWTLTLAAAVAAVSAGTGVAAVSEAGQQSFSGLGLALMLASSAFEALRSVAVQQLTRADRQSVPLHAVMTHISWASAAGLWALSSAVERGAWRSAALLLRVHRGRMLATAALSAATNLTGYSAIRVCLRASTHEHAGWLW